MGMGDSPSSWNSRIYRVDYANDTVAASPSGPTSFGPAATSSPKGNLFTVATAATAGASAAGNAMP